LYTSNLGELITLTCFSDNEVTWKFHSTKSVNNLYENHTPGTNEYYLHINHFYKANSGLYSCEGEDYNLGIAFIDFGNVQLYGN